LSGRQYEASLHNAKEEHTSGVLSRDLNLATRSCVVTGPFCNKTALISSSVTGPVEPEVDPVFDDGGVTLGVAVPLVAGELSSFTAGFTSCFKRTLKLIGRLVITDI
jgi:hypothetical protein